MATSEDTLETITGLINAHWKKMDDHRATLAVLVAQAKRMVEANADPKFIRGRTWREFAFEEFDGRCPKEIAKLVRMGNSSDPLRAHEAEKSATRERVRNLRERRADQARQTEGAYVRSSGPPLSEEGMIEAFERAWLVIPRHRQDEALHRIGATRAVTQRAA